MSFLRLLAGDFSRCNTSLSLHNREFSAKNSRVIRFAEIQARVDRTTSIGERHLGHPCALLVWHEEDLVDDAERWRNDVIFAWQGNRNPFVDHLEWLQSIWGDGR